jgi:hypothetical protein
VTTALADTGQPADVRLPERWWQYPHVRVLLAGYRRLCVYCDAPRAPQLHSDPSSLKSWLLGPALYQVCSGCGQMWHDGVYTSSLALIADTIHLRLRGARWWVYDQVTLEALRSCPDVRGMFDLIWQRMERAGRCIEVRGGHG